MLIKKPHSPWRAAASLLVGLSTVTGLMLTQVGTASALSASGPSEPTVGQTPSNESGTVSVNATISGGGTDPTIECGWVLGDHNPKGGAETQQYAFAIGANVGPSTGPNFTQPVQGKGYSTGPTPPTFSNNVATGSAFVYGQDITPGNTSAPCTSPGTAGSQPSMFSSTQDTSTNSWSNPVSTGITINPNVFDNPAPRRVELWSAVDGASTVIYDVFYPDGKEDVELGAVEIGGSQSTGAQCSPSNSTYGSLLTNMFAAAGPGEDNEISGNAITNSSGTGIQDLCQEGQKGLWHQAFTISKDDPNGKYVVEIRASNTSGGQSVAWESFVVDPVFSLAIDFSSLNFTNNGTGQYEVTGDTVFGSGGPTVTNGGNSGEQVGVNFTQLTFTPEGGGSSYYISNFNANLGYNASDILGTPVSVPAGTTTFIPSSGTASGAQLVCPNDDSKLDLSVEPPAGTPAGTYTGTMTVWAESAVPTTGNCPTDDGHPYVVGSSNASSPPNYGPGFSFKSLSDNDAPALYRT
jgi:hypothetical protein